MSKTKKTLIIALALVALLALAGSVIAYARVSKSANSPQESGETDPAMQGSEDPGLAGQALEDPGLAGQSLANRPRPRAKAPRNWLEGSNIDYDALLADALDITVEELHDAREEAKAAAMEQAVDEGTITQRQADLIVAVRVLRGAINRGELVAGALGITVEELQEARQDRALRELLAELDMTPADVKEAVLAEYETFVQQAVEDEIITEEQAELVLERPGLVLDIQQGLQARGGVQGRGAGRGNRGGRGPGSGGTAPFQGGIRLLARSGALLLSP